MASPAPALLVVTEMVFPVLPLLAGTSLAIPPAPLYFIPCSIAVCVLLFHPAPSTVLASSSIYDPPIPRHSTRRFHLHSHLCPLPPRSTPLLLWHCLPGGCGPGPIIRAPGPSSPSPPLSSESLPLDRHSSSFLRHFSSPLLWHLPPCHPLGSCSRLPRPARPLPQPWPSILPVRTKMSAIG